MRIRFCEFCSTIHPDETTHCPDCGTRLAQTVREEDFNNPNNPWPFIPVSCIQLEIQGKPREIQFNGTHSVYHLWSELHNAYRSATLYFRENRDEIELARYPEGHCPDGFQRLDPVSIMASRHAKYSFYTYELGDPELSETQDALEMTYQGSFEIVNCPQRYWKDILGWMVATAPHNALEQNWHYWVC